VQYRPIYNSCIVGREGEAGGGGEGGKLGVKKKGERKCKQAKVK